MKKILAWSDSPLAPTGFGTVARHVLTALHSTGRYHIEQIGINSDGRFVSGRVPWEVAVPLSLNPKEPYGFASFLRAYEEGDYDYVWVLNDVQVLASLAPPLSEVKERMRKAGLPLPHLVWYYPMDGTLSEAVAMGADVADTIVSMSHYGTEQMLLVRPDAEGRMEYIPHGVDTSTFRRLPGAERLAFRRDVLGVQDDETLIINVNQNTPRKAIPDTVRAFAAFRKTHCPTAKLYLHTQTNFKGGDLSVALNAYGLLQGGIAKLPREWGVHHAPPPETLNKIYNAGDLYLSTHLGEGWGLTITEAMAVGCPVVVPNNSCMPQHIGEDERGIMYPCEDVMWMEVGGYRPRGFIGDIVGAMRTSLYSDPKLRDKRVQMALAYARSLDWSLVTQEWVRLFERLDVQAEPAA